MNIKKENKNILFIFIVNLIFSLIFFNAHYWTGGTTLRCKSKTYIILLFLLVIIPIAFWKISKLNQMISNAKEKLFELVEYIENNQKKIMKLLFQYFCVICCCMIAGYFMGELSVKLFSNYIKEYVDYFHNNIIMSVSVSVGGIVVFTLVKFKNVAYEKIHYLVFALILIIGTFFCSIVPAEVGITWDDEVHYLKVTGMADYFSDVSYKADDLLIKDYQYVATYHDGYKLEDRIERANELNSSYKNKELREYTYELSVRDIGYFPQFLGVVIGRGLNLSYIHTFLFGRFLSLLCYACIVSLSVYVLKSGKILMAFISMFPIAVYMAGSYSYDPWILSFSLLGFSYFFNMLIDHKIKNESIIKMLLSFAVSFVVKPVYFPALFMLLFVPKEKFISTKQRRIYLTLVFMTAILLAFSIVAPMLLGGSFRAYDDMRGGDGVNSAEQMKYILNYPIKYINTLINHGKDYLSIKHVYEYSQNYGYMSYVIKPPFSKLASISLVTVSILDQEKEKKRTPLIIVLGIFGIICAIVLVASSMYLAYTPVGLPYIEGCQFRYLLHLVFPTIYLLSLKLNFLKINKNRLTLFSLFIECATFVFWTGANVFVSF